MKGSFRWLLYVEEKHRRELTSIEYMTKSLLAPISQAIADEFMQLWLEYEESSTPEAIFVKDGSYISS